jgi:hypothetical protein
MYDSKTRRSESVPPRFAGERAAKFNGPELLGYPADSGNLLFGYCLAYLREFGLGLNPQTTGVVEQLVDAVVRNFVVQQFADARLRLPKDCLKILL